MARLRTLLRFLCFSPMQTYYICVILLGLFGSCIYFLIYTSTNIVSPLAPCTNGILYLDGNLTGTGFVMALDFSDQLTGGGMNLFCLQCLAYSIDPNIVVVEPFIVQSTFGVAMDLQNPLSETPWKGNAVRMSDVYDMEKWLKYSKAMCFAPLVRWEALLDTAPRNVVLVQHTWDNDCSLQMFNEKYTPFFLLNHFQVVREVCFNFKASGQLELWRYKHSIYGELDPTRVTVIYEKWLGVSGKQVSKYTVSIADSYCEKESTGGPLFNNFHASPSQKLYSQASLYTSRFLGGVTNNMYIAVMLRIEQIFVSTSKRINKLGLVTRCLANLVKKWEYMKKSTGITETFLALDYGRYGSKGFMLHEYMDRHILEDKLTSLLQTMGQGNFTVWESRFKEVASTDNPGYIASLQQTIGSEARCLITTGGGSFQNHAFVVHRKRYGKTCSIRLRTNCKLLDTFVKFSLQPTTTTSTNAATSQE